MMEKRYGSTLVQKEIGLTRMQVQYLVTTGCVIPKENARGRGSRRKFDWVNMVEFVICKRLQSLTFEAYFIKDILGWLRKMNGTPYWTLVNWEPNTPCTLLVIYNDKTRWHSGRVEAKQMAGKISYALMDPGSLERFFREYVDSVDNSAVLILIDLSTAIKKFRCHDDD